MPLFFFSFYRLPFSILLASFIHLTRVPCDQSKEKKQSETNNSDILHQDSKRITYFEQAALLLLLSPAAKHPTLPQRINKKDKKEEQPPT